MSSLFSPIALRGVTLPNRIVVSPMCQYSAQDGLADAWHLAHVMSMALSGAGMMTLEATAVESDGRITPGCLGLWDEATEAALRPVLAAVRRHTGTALAIQLSHAGRKASSAVPWKGGGQIRIGDGGWRAHAPSAVAHAEGEEAPIALDEAGLDRVKRAFVAAAERAVRLGVDAIELHGAHGYLLHEFLSPVSNRRTDSYGGSLENRMRFPLEVFDALRAVLPEGMPLGVKVSATDWVDGGWDLDGTVAFARALRLRGVDWIAASSGGASPKQKIAVGPGYQVPFAEAIRADAGVATMAVGLITEAEQAEAIVAEGRADLVAVGRGMLYDPRWGWHAAAALGGTVEAPPPYWRAPPQGRADLFHGTAHGAR